MICSSKIVQMKSLFSDMNMKHHNYFFYKLFTIILGEDLWRWQTMNPNGFSTNGPQS
jgi:hypothetical protein